MARAAVAGRIAVVLAFVLCLSAPPAQAQTTHKLFLAGYVEARDVTLTVSFLPDARATEPVASPAPTDFTLFENEEPVQAEFVRLPEDAVEVVLVLETKRTDANFVQMMDAAAEFVAGLPPTAKVAVVSADEEPKVVDEMAPVEGWSREEALDGLVPTEGTSVIEAIGLAAEQFPERPPTDGLPLWRRIIAVYAEGYQGDPSTVGAEVSERLVDRHIDTYVIGSARSYAGNVSSFPVPLGAGRRHGVEGGRLLGGAKEIATQLRSQYRARVPAQVEKGAAVYLVRIGDESSELVGKTTVNVPALEQPERWGPKRIVALALGVVLLIAVVAAILFIPPRVRAARAARARLPEVRLDPEPDPGPAVTGAAELPIRAGPAPETVRARPMGVGGEQVEGVDAVRELLRVGRRSVRVVWMADGVDDPVLVDLAQHAHVPIRRVSVGEFRSACRSSFSGGVLALTSSIPSTPIEQLCRSGGRAVSIVVLHGPVEPQMLAGLTRAAASAGFSGIVLVQGRTAPVSPAATALARGAMEHVRFSLVNNLPSSIARLKRLGCVTIGIDPGTGVRLGDLDVDLSTAPVALVVGAGGGLDRRLRGRCDLVANIEPSTSGSAQVPAIAALACVQLSALRSAPMAAPDPRG